MNNDYLTPEEQLLKQRLRAMPRHTLNISARTAMREQMVREFRVQAEAPWQPVIHRNLSRGLLQVAGLVAVIGLVVGLLFLQGANHQTSSTSTAIPTFTEPPPALIQTQIPVLITVGTRTPSPEIPATPLNQPNIPATAIPFTLAPVPTLLPSASPTVPNNSNLVVIEGPVSAIAGNHITVYSFDIQVLPQDPVLPLLAVSDIVHVEGRLAPNRVVNASSLGRFVNSPSGNDATGTTTLSGRIESIKGSQLTVNGVPVSLALGDPVLQKLKVGNVVEVWGSFEGSGANSVLVALHLTIANPLAVTNSGANANNGGNSGVSSPVSTNNNPPANPPPSNPSPSNPPPSNPPPSNPPPPGKDDDGMGMGDDGMGMGGGMGGGMGMGG